jgi:signal transduction histidine kinase
MLETKDSLLLILFFGTCSLILFFAGMLLFVFKYQRKVLLHQQELARKEDEKQKELLRAVIESQENTQNFIAKELHDGILQEMATLRFGTTHISSQFKKHEIPLDTINQLKSDIDSSIKNIRLLSHSILPSLLEEEGLAAALKSISVKINSSETTASVFLVTGDYFEQTKDVQLAFFRVVQEAVQNSIKYAEAKNIDILLAFEQKKCTVSILDDGKGYNIQSIVSKGIGLKNMQSRAKVIDAEIEFISELNKGTKVVMEKTYI